MSILGIDPSQSGTGLYSTKTDRAETIKPGDTWGPQRLDIIDRRVNEVIVTVRPQLAVIEGYSYGSEFAREMAGEVGGLVRLAVYRHGIPWVVVPPSSLKEFATGNPRAKKPEMAQAAWDQWNRRFGDDNQVDAYWLTVLGIYLTWSPSQWPNNRSQIKVLAAVSRNPHGKDGK